MSSRIGQKYEKYTDEDYNIIYTMKLEGKPYSYVQQIYPRLKYKTFASINSYEKKSPLKQFKKEVETIVIDQLLQNPKLNTLLQEKEQKQLKNLIRRLTKIQYGPNGVKRPKDKENKDIRRSKTEIRAKIFKYFELNPIPNYPIQKKKSEIDFEAQSVFNDQDNSIFFDLNSKRIENFQLE